jgi:hypothetical protein
MNMDDVRYESKRMWINQPSINQPDHDIHGKNVIAIPLGRNEYLVFFIDGEEISRIVNTYSLSYGWKKEVK